MSRRHPIGAVCVIRKGCEAHWASKVPDKACPVKDGQVVRVVGHIDGRAGNETRGYLLAGISAKPFRGFAHQTLRRITKAKSDFTAQIRASRPVKQDEPA